MKGEYRTCSSSQQWCPCREDVDQFDSSWSLEKRSTETRELKTDNLLEMLYDVTSHSMQAAQVVSNVSRFSIALCWGGFLAVHSSSFSRDLQALGFLPWQNKIWRSFSPQFVDTGCRQNQGSHAHTLIKKASCTSLVPFLLCHHGSPRFWLAFASLTKPTKKVKNSVE